MVERREKEADGPACKNAGKLSEDADSYLTEARQERGPVRLLIMERFTKKDEVEENEESQPAESYLSEAPKCSSTYQGGSLIITGRFKFIYGSP